MTSSDLAGRLLHPKREVAIKVQLRVSAWDDGVIDLDDIRGWSWTCLFPVHDCSVLILARVSWMLAEYRDRDATQKSA